MKPSIILIVSIYFSLVGVSHASDDSYTKLRHDTASKENYNPDWKYSSERAKIFDAIKEKNYHETLKLSEAWTTKLPVDIEVYNICAIAAHHLNNQIKKIHCMEKYYGLLSSILKSGDGLSMDTAFKVISIAEEYALIYEYNGKLKKQKLLHRKNAVYDLMIIEINGKKIILYFDVTIPWIARQKLHD